MDVNELKELIELFENSELTELEIEEDGRRMRLQRNLYPRGNRSAVLYGGTAAADAAAPAAAPVPTSEDAEPEETYNEVIKSPMVGTFYAAPAPGEARFVHEGDQVEDGQTVCIVEAMKLMNEVGATSHCIIEKVLVENGQPVEFGQPLFAIRKV